MNDIHQNTQESVQKFYDTIGWKRTDKDLFTDAARFDDWRNVTAEYRHKCHMRLNRYISHSGKFILDIASGPIQYPEYLSYSEGYRYRICADISRRALTEARKILYENDMGQHGLYVQCDITNLPFINSSIDTSISLHTIYHVQKDKQIRAFYELHRIIKPNSQAVIVYSWSRYSLLMAITLPIKLLTYIKNIAMQYFNKLARREPANQEPLLYFYAYPYQWFVRNISPLMKIDIAIWRSVNIQFLKYFIQKYFFGKAILLLIYNIEERFPQLIGKIGAYPIIIIRK